MARISSLSGYDVATVPSGCIERYGENDRDFPSPGVTGEPPKAMKQLQEPTDSIDLDVMVDRAVKGDALALDRVLGRIHPVVVRYCRSRMSAGHRSSASADDVAQEVCMAVITALPTFRHEGKPFLAFVYGICAHKVADAHRVAARSRSHSVADVPDSPTTERGPEQRMVASSTAAVIEGLLNTLPETQQEILRLRVVVGLSAEETAEALAMTAGAVRVSQHRALAKLRHLLSNDAALTEQLV
jgi:RNA polymerase sigma-70 factor (ECF subfamily)